MMTAGIGIFLLIGIVAVLVVVVLWAIGVYNRLVTLRNRVDNTWAQIDVQLKRRYDLIPNLVETVKGYAKHERETFENVTKARAAAMGARTPGEVAQAEGMLAGALKSLFAVAEAYPDLKANQNFLQLQGELSTTENRISVSRDTYNETVREFNTRTQLFPANLLAGMFGFRAREFFKVDTGAERQAPKVQF
jgi:LemA protein